MLVGEDSKSVQDGTSSMTVDLGREVVFSARMHYPKGLNFGRDSLKVARNLKAAIYRDEEGLDKKMRVGLAQDDARQDLRGGCNY